MAAKVTAEADDPGLAELIPSWTLEMQSQRLSKNSVKLYLAGMANYTAWCGRIGEPVRLTKEQVLRYLVATGEDLNLDASSAGSYLKGIKSFARWCYLEGETDRNEIAGVRAPTLDDKIQPTITVDQHAAILATCDLRTFAGKRDDALIRLMGDAGGRAKEVVRLQMDEIHVAEGYALIHGKGRKDRFIAFGPDTALSIDRYRRARRRHQHVASSNLWLGVQTSTYGYTALWKMVKRRAALAGIPEEEVAPHAWRRKWADAWLDRGGSEGGLKALGGWSSLASVEPYVKRNANQRALREDKRLREEGGRAGE